MPLRRRRNGILIVLLALAVGGWVAVIAQSRRDMGMGDDMMMPGPDLTMGRSAPLFFAMWVSMMVAMMFPAAAPMIMMYGRMQKSRYLNVALFTGSYIALWFVFGAVAFGLGILAESLAERSMWVMEHWARAGGALLVLAGLYQLSPLKDVCLKQCRTPLSFVLSHWRDGAGGAARMGLTHGMYCLGCCWLLFLVLVPLGVMNIAAMLAVTALVFAEKALPRGEVIAKVAAVGLVIYGALVIVRPALLPTVG